MDCFHVSTELFFESTAKLYERKGSVAYRLPAKFLKSLPEIEPTDVEGALDSIRITDIFIKGYLATITPCEAVTLLSVLIDEAAVQICGMKNPELRPEWCPVLKMVSGIVTVVKTTLCASSTKTAAEIKSDIQTFNICQAIKFTSAELKALSIEVCKINSPEASIACRYLNLIIACLEPVKTFVCNQD
jgi:hypothetical protein